MNTYLSKNLTVITISRFAIWQLDYNPVLQQKPPFKMKVGMSLFAGKVYNITPYMDFHPGGVPELMRAAGKDGTKLFDEVRLPMSFSFQKTKYILIIMF